MPAVSSNPVFHRTMNLEKEMYYGVINPTIEMSRETLEALAYEKVMLLKEIESEIFEFTIVDGELVPENKNYWLLQQNSTVPVFLKIE